MSGINWERFNIKTYPQSFFRRWIWILVVVISVGGMFYPLLGWGMPPMMILLVLLSVFKGRYWCGNICPRGSFFDTVVKWISMNKKIHRLFTNNIFRVVVLVLFFAFVGFRLFNVFQGDNLYVKLGFVFATLCLVSTVIGVVLGTIFAPRTWCSFCPMGTFQKWLNRIYTNVKISLGKKLTKKKITLDPEKCIKCATCSRVCPMQLEPFKEAQDNNKVEHPDCIQCKTCVEQCPMNALDYAREAPDTKDKSEGTWAIISEVKNFSNAREFTFKTDKNLDIMAGQAILMRVSESPEVFRAFSVVSNYKNKVTIAMKPVEDGLASSYVYSLQKGERVYIEGPKGDMVLGKANNKYFVGVGIGITPFVSMAEEALKAGDNVVLFHGARTGDELYYSSFFEKFSEKYSGFSYIPTVSREKNPKYKTGRVTKHLQNAEIPADAESYVCGMPALVKEVNKILREKGIPEKQIKTESF